MAAIFLESVIRTLLQRFGELTKPSNRPKMKLSLGAPLFDLWIDSDIGLAIVSGEIFLLTQTLFKILLLITFK